MKDTGCWIAAVFLLLTGCAKVFDKESPSAEFTNGKDTITLSIQDSVMINFELSDSSGLYQYRIYSAVAPATDLIDSTRTGIALTPWQCLKIDDITTNPYIGTAMITCNNANTLPGYYYLILQASDNDFNLGSDTLVIRIIHPADTTGPGVLLDSPQTGATIAIGDTVHIQGVLYDNDNSGLPGGVYKATFKLSSDNPTLAPIIITTLNDIKQDAFDFDYIVGLGTPTGAYNLRLVMKDHYNNLDSLDFPFNIVE